MRESTAVRAMTEGLLHEQLRVHVSNSPYPEYLKNLTAVKKAIVLCACGQQESYVVARGYTTKAGILMAALELESFVWARIVARFN